MDVLPDKIAADGSLKDAVVSKSIGDIGQLSPFLYACMSSWMMLGDAQLTEQTPSVDLEVELGVGLHNHPCNNKAIFMPCSHRFHKAGCSERFLILEVGQLGHIDVGRAGRQGREREALSHDGRSWG